MRGICLLFVLTVACATTESYEREWPADHLPAPMVLSEEGEPGGGGEPSHEADEDEEFKNVAGLFVGYTTERGDGGFTIGLEYERRLNRWLGVGVFGEWIAGDIEASAVGAGVYLRPIRKTAVVIMPGVEWEKGEAGDAMLRVGLIYDLWRSGQMIVVPAVYADLFRGAVAIVAGVTVAWEF